MSPSLELQREGIRKAWGWARVQEGRVRGDCRVESVVERAKAILKKKIIRPNYTVVIPTRNSYPPPQPAALSSVPQLPCDCRAKGPEEGGEKFIKNF
jgi:hypothetical protein